MMNVEEKLNKLIQLVKDMNTTPHMSHKQKVINDQLEKLLPPPPVPKYKHVYKCPICSP